MAVPQRPFLAAVLLLVSHGIQCSPPLPACPVPCLCQRGPLLNCSSSGLSLSPRHLQATVTELDLSHNLLDSLTLRRPNRNLRNLWLGNNSITRLSLCIERTTGSQYASGRLPQYSRPWSRQGCVSWAPVLQLLSVERNQLVQLPEGLRSSGVLQILQLSHNRISTLQAGGLSHLQQLKELHLQHNLITSIHPEALGELAQLRVLDLSFNLLTTLPPLTYLSLRNLGAEVKLRGIRWQCDCRMQSVRRWMAYDSDRGQQAWSMVCASPSALSGRDLLQLEDDDLICFNAEDRPELHKDVTVDEGCEILLPCPTQQDSKWWTPNGQVSVSQSQAGLLISDITERDAGLYVCVSESQQEFVSIFNVQIRKMGEEENVKSRRPRSLPRGSRLIIPQGVPHRMAQGRNQRTTTQSNLVLAVCLSVFITFLVAFIIGVLARPLIDVLWRRVCSKKRTSSTNSDTSAEQRPYDNEAYSDGEEPVEIGTHRERRVTFSTIDVRENSNAPYYDTVASGNHGKGNEDAVVDCEVSEAKHQSEEHKPKAGDSGRDGSSQQGSPEDNPNEDRDVTHPGPTHRMEFEHIPDPSDLQERRSLSSHSDTSHSDKEQEKDQMTQKDHKELQIPQLVVDPFQQTTTSLTVKPVEVPQVFVDGQSEIPGFTSEPFSKWSPHVSDANLDNPDLWNDSGENFEFTDSVRSGSARSSSLFSSFNNSNQKVFPPSDNLRRSDSSSSSSSSTISVDEPTQYTVNPEREEEEAAEVIQNARPTHDTKPETMNPCLKQGVIVKHQAQDEDPIRPSLQEGGFNQGDHRHDTQRPPTEPEHYDSSHSSDSDGEPTQYTVNQEKYEEDAKERNVSKFDKSAGMVTVHSDRADETSSITWTDLEPQARWPGLSFDVPHTSNVPGTTVPSPPAADSASSTSESEAEMTDHKGEQKKQRIEVGFTGRQHETQWPDLDLRRIPKIERRLDIKAPSRPPESFSSSESQDNTTDLKTDLKVPLKQSEVVSHEPETRWSDVNLDTVTHIKRRLDIKAPSPPPDSSSSSEDEEETQDLTVKQGGDNTHKQPPLNPVFLSSKRATRMNSDSSESSTGEVEETDRFDLRSSSQKAEPKPGSRWPDLGLSSSTYSKSRLDIKAPSPPLGSFSSSESQDNTTDLRVKHQKGEFDTVKVPLKQSEVVSHEPETRWSDLNLDTVTHIKRRLDIKAPSPPPDSSSSSEDEEETKDLTVKQGGDNTHKQPPLNPVFLSSKRATRMNSDSSESSTGEVEETDRFDLRSSSQKADPKPGSRWPDLGLSSSTYIKRRLDIKAPSPPPDSSSSSSESEDENTDSTMKLERGQTDAGFASYGSETKRPDLSLGITKIKRDWDIKGSSPQRQSYSTSSSSESENEMTQEITNREPETKWPDLSLGVPRVKKRLDIRAPSPSPRPGPGLGGVSPGPLQAESNSSSSESEDENRHHTGKLEREVHQVSGSSTGKESILSTKDTLINIFHTPKKDHGVKLESYATITDELEDETAARSISPEPIAKPERESQWAGLSLGVSRFRRRLDIMSHKDGPPKVPSSPPPESSSSSSESEDESKGHRVKQQRRGVGVQEIAYRASSLNPKDKPLTLKNTDSIDSDKSVEVKGLRTDYSFPTTEKEPGPGPTVAGLGVSLKKRLDIKAPAEAPPASPASQSSDSSSSSENGDERTDNVGKGWRETAQLPAVRDKESPRSPVSLYPTRASKVEGESESRWPDLSIGGVPSIKRRLDIKAPSPPQSESSSSSSSSESEDDRNTAQLKRDDTDMEITSHEQGTKWSGLSPGVPHVKRHLIIKAPSPQPTHSSSFTSESKQELTDHTERYGMDFSGVAYKESQNTSLNPETKWSDRGFRSIPSLKKHLDIKAPSPPPFDSSTSSSETIGHTKHEKLTVAQDDLPLSVGGINVSLAPRRALNISFDEVVRRRIEEAAHTPDLRWSGIGHHSSDLSITSPRRHLDANIHLPPEALPAILETRPQDSSSSSSDSEDEMKLEKDKAQITPSDKLSSPRRALDTKFDNSSSSRDEIEGRAMSEGRRGRKGLSALKAMLSERQRWDTEHEALEGGSSSSGNDQGLSFQGATSFKYHSSEKDIEPIAKVSLPESLLSKTRPWSSLNRIPQHRRYVAGDIQPPLETPPPVPGAVLPEGEEAGPTRRSPQTSEKQNWKTMESHQQRERTENAFGLYSQSSISRGDEEEKDSALLAQHITQLTYAAPYRPARSYQSVTSNTTQIVSFDHKESNMTSTTISKNSAIHFDIHNQNISDA